MENQWSDHDAEAYIERFHAQGYPPAVGLRIYSTNLLGNDSKLVVHGGGNTSLKLEDKNLFQETQPTLWIKGSGKSMAKLLPKDMPALWLRPLLKLGELDDLPDQDLVNQQRIAMVDPNGPNPSVEVMLHALLPHKFIDHTHASAVLSVTNQPNAHKLCKQIFGDRVAIVDYMRPGFNLAKRTMEAFQADPNVEGIILLKHGIVTFGETAKQSYDRMIELVNVAENALKSVSLSRPPAMPKTTPRADLLPTLRGILKGNQPEILVSRTNEKCRQWSTHPMLEKLSQRGVSTPDHIIRTKFKPLILEVEAHWSTEDLRENLSKQITQFEENYRTWFNEHNASYQPPKTMNTPSPRVLIVRGYGVIGIGENFLAADLAADIAERNIDTIMDAESLGTFESINDKEAFDMEYWDLEQAKLRNRPKAPFQGLVTLVTGGAGAIGCATARAFKVIGSEVAILDLEQSKGPEIAEKHGFKFIPCDVTNPQNISEAFDAVTQQFGGVDIVVSNAGRAVEGLIGELDPQTLQREFDLNFFSHQMISQSALKIFRSQGYGGQILFNISKQAVNPGPKFGAYGLPKAATLALMRQYAIDHGREGVRVNGVNADRIRSGLLTDDMIEARAKSRGLTRDDYLCGNLLGVEVTAKDVASAFLYLASAAKTTGCVITVDGGNVAANLR